MQIVFPNYFTPNATLDIASGHVVCEELIYSERLR